MDIGNRKLSLGTLVDRHERVISYLRLSLTDRCNLRCRYCVSDEEQQERVVKLARDELLTYEELLRVIRIAVPMGISKIRLTGGEPLVRRDIISFVRNLGSIEGLDDIRMTTNGVLLGQFAGELLAAGVRKINISLDTLKRERFAEITGSDSFSLVWESINSVLALGFSSVKLNMVVMRGVNDDEIPDFARLALERKLQIRFIEFMPIGASTRWSRDAYMSSDEIMDRMSSLGELMPLEKSLSDGPARVFKLGKDSVGTLGFISPVSHHFCDRCNRLRLTSEGRLRSCLLNDHETDLRKVLRQGCNDGDIAKTLLGAIYSKPKGHHLEEKLLGEQGTSGLDCHGMMSRIGG
jgi:cyclic pyranopterin phosphate synthase